MLGDLWRIFAELDSRGIVSRSSKFLLDCWKIGCFFCGFCGCNSAQLMDPKPLTQASRE